MSEVKCPRCKTKTKYSPKNPFRPFCSERCKMIDLGKWADEEYSIPTADNESFDVNENPEDVEGRDFWTPDSTLH